MGMKQKKWPTQKNWVESYSKFTHVTPMFSGFVYKDLQWYLMSNLLGLFSSLISKANLSERGRKLKSYKIETVCEMAPWHNWQLSRQSLSLFCVQIDCSAHSSKIYNNGSNNRYPWKKRDPTVAKVKVPSLLSSLYTSPLYAQQQCASPTLY